MRYIVNAKEMKQYDETTIHHYGIPGMVLIERAALAAVEEIKKNTDGRRVLIACGSGNNGADGLVVARLLHLDGYIVTVWYVGNERNATKENQNELNINKQYGIPTIYGKEDLDSSDYDVIVDGIIGVGLSRTIEGSYYNVIDELNQMSGLKVAFDIPSGVCADTGKILGIAFHADLTITFSFEKIGMYLFPGWNSCGRIVLKEVGIDKNSFLDRKPGIQALEDTDIEMLVPKRRGNTNKGSYGKVLVVAGSVNMSGAAILSAKAAYRMGSGLVKVFTPEENRIIIQSTLPEAILTTYKGNGNFDAEKELIEAIQWADVIVCGPGLSQSVTAKKIVKICLSSASVPMILDADALNIIAEEPELLLKPHTELIVTPHPGEMARLRQTTVSYVKDDLVRIAEEFAREYHVISVLKDARTIVSVPFGATYLNLSGNNGMATAGSGDVLTGIIAGLIAQGANASVAAPLGVFIHGKCGEAAKERVGCYSMMASDLIDAISEILK